MRRAPALFLVTLLAVASPAAACLWDTDTLLDERRGMPTVAAILAGKWERHSTFFYEQRILASRKKLDADPKNLAAMDDLAVALEKTGRVSDAIDVMRRKLEIDPNGYTTHANLSTFYLHAGHFENGIAHIKRALEINPDAHFGRERYQLMAAEYLRDGKRNPAVFEAGSLAIFILYGDESARREVGDAEYLKAISSRRPQLHHGRGSDTPPVAKAIEGIVGMIRFGTGTSPDLFYALGDLLTARGDRHLAYRAYRRAVELGHPHSEQVRDAMERVRDRHEDHSGFADDVIAAERAEGARWVAAYQAYEDELLRGGRDVADPAQFAAFYKQHGDPRAVPSKRAAWLARARSLVHRQPVILLPVAAAVVLVVVQVVRMRRNRARRAVPTPPTA